MSQMLPIERLSNGSITLAESKSPPPTSRGWQDLDPLSAPQNYPSGLELFKQGSVPKDVWFISKGLVKLVNLSQDGREIIVALRSSGWPLGAAAALLKIPSPVTATTITRCDVTRISAEHFCHLAQTDTHMSWLLNQSYSREVNDQIGRIVDLGSSSARLRLERLIGQFISAQGAFDANTEIRLRVPLRHWEMAQLLAVSPEHLSRMLTRLVKDGMIRRTKGWIVIPQPQRLRHLWPQ